MLDEVAGNLPYGLQRLVSIAIAFAARPSLLCLDEPLTGLNQTEAMAVLAIFRRMREEHGISIPLVEHNMKAVNGYLRPHRARLTTAYSSPRGRRRKSRPIRT